MSPIAVIRTIESLLPQIVKSGNAERCLLEHARANNLAPEQLQKMATTLNTARSLSWMENNPDMRGATIPLVDPVKLAAAYTNYSQPTLPVKRASVAVLDGPTQVPDFFKAASAPAPVKSATTVDAATPTSKEVAYEGWLEKQACALRNVETTQMVREDAWEEFDKVATKIAKAIRNSPGAHAEMREDIQQLFPSGCSSFDYAAGLASQYTKLAAVTDHKATKRYIVRDRHGVMDLVKAAAGCLDRVRACDMLIDEIAAEGDLIVEKSASARRPAFTDPEEDVGTSASGGASQAGGPPPRTGPDVRRAPRPQGNGMPRRDMPPNPQPAGGRPQGARRGQPAVAGGGRGAGGGGAGGETEEGDDKPGKDRPQKSMGDSTVDFASHVAKMLTGLSDGLSSKTESMFGASAKPGINLMLSDYAPGKRQQKIDRGVTEVRTVTNLQRLMLADPILQEANPEQLVAIFNSLQQDDPTIGQNMSRLRFALREALQYDGAVPIQTSKALADLDKTRLDADLKRRATMSEIYG